MLFGYNISWYMSYYQIGQTCYIIAGHTTGLMQSLNGLRLIDFLAETNY